MGKFHLFIVLNTFLLFAQITNISAKNKGRLLTPNEGCGFSKVGNTKIVGGTAAKPGAFPWIVLLGYRNADPFMCGGSLITTRHVLTAAHCLRPTLASVKIGVHNRFAWTDRESREIRVIRSRGHPNYDDTELTSDIAILYLERDVVFTDRIRPICLPLNEQLQADSFVGANPFIAGWGTQVDKHGQYSDVLLHAQVPVIDYVECQHLIEEEGELISGNPNDNSIICAGNMAGGTDTCQGDSGGPLMLPIQVNGTFPMYQIGVVSWGIGCGHPHSPGIYTRVSFFIDWIKQQVATPA